MRKMGLGVMASIWAATAQAGPVQVIDDRSFFQAVPHTLIDFSTRGNGTAWPPLTPGQTFGFSESEYISSGVRISTAGNFPFFPRVIRSPDSGAIPVALEQAGSVPFFISEFAEDGFLRFDFEEPIQAFGIAVLRTIGDGRGPVRLEAMDVNGIVVGIIPFEGDLVDGIIDGTPLGNTADIEYGFLGFQSQGSPIGTVFLHDDFAYYDDLHFSVIPEPQPFVLIISITLPWILRGRLFGYRRVVFFFMIIAVAGNIPVSRGDITGTIMGKVQTSGPPICGLPPSYVGCAGPVVNDFKLKPLAGVRVCIQGGICRYTLPDGSYVVPTTGTSDVVVTADFDGLLTRVGALILNPNPPPLYFLVSQNGKQSPSLPATSQWNPVFNSIPSPGTTNGEILANEVTTFYYVQSLRTFWKYWQPEFTALNVTLDVEANGTSCNASYGTNGTTNPLISLGISGFSGGLDEPCATSAIPSAIAHEFGHFVLARMGFGNIEGGENSGGGTFGFGEGFGDALAILFLDDPEVGKGITAPNTPAEFSLHRSYLFSAENQRVIVNNGGGIANAATPSVELDKAHEQGQLLAGIWWDLKELLQAKYDDPLQPPPCPVSYDENDPDHDSCGLELTRKMFTQWARVARNSEVVLPEAILSVNDDDDDLWTDKPGQPPSTPDYKSISQAFRLHNALNSGASGYYRAPFDDCNASGQAIPNDIPDWADICTTSTACQDRNKNRVPDFCEGFANQTCTANTCPGQGVGCTATRIRYVNHLSPAVGTEEDGTCWNRAYKTLDKALDCFFPGQGGDIALACSVREIWVARGTYTPCSGASCPRSSTFLLPGGVRIYGGFIGNETELTQRRPIENPTILSGDLLGDDSQCATPPCNAENAFHVVTANPLSIQNSNKFADVGAATLLDGFEVTGGNANGAALQLNDIGGGILFVDAAPTIRNCNFTRNNAVNGAGAYVLASDRTTTGATAGGAIGLSPSFRGCTFSFNGATNHAGGMYIDGASPLIDNCLFLTNATGIGSYRGGAVYSKGGLPGPIIRRSTIKGNTSFLEGGAIYVASGDTSIEGCLITGNSTDNAHGTAIFSNSAGRVRILNSTITNNTNVGPNGTFSLEEATIFNTIGAMDVANSILWGNCRIASISYNCTGHDIQFTSVRPFVTNSILVGTGFDPSNIPENPRFVNAEAGDFSLSCGSPAIDRGDNSALPSLLTTDLAGNPRKADDLCTADCQGCTSPVVDLGALERQHLGLNCNGNGMDDCAEIAANSQLDCNHNCVLDVCDIASGGSLDSNLSSIPDECEGAPMRASPPHDRLKNRYISFTPSQGLTSVAYRVEKLAQAANAGFCTGNPGVACTGAPAQGTCPSGSHCESPYPQGNPGGFCWVQTPSAGSNNDEFTAKCDATPVFRIWSEPVIHVGDCEIIPVSKYQIQSATAGPVFSIAALSVQTIEQPSFNGKIWGDTVGINSGVEWLPPNRFANVQDVLAILAFISGAAIKPHFTVVNLQETSANDSCLNSVVNVADVLIANQAISGATYRTLSAPKIIDPNCCPVCPCGTACGATGPNCPLPFTGGGGGMEEQSFAGGGEGFFGPENFSTTPTFDLSVTPYQIDAEETATISVYLNADQVISGYEVSLDVTGGTTGSLSRETIVISTQQADFIFAGHGTYLATNVATNQAGAVEASGTGVLASSEQYLATYTLLASSDAEGVFEVRVSDERSFILDAEGNQVAHDASVVAYVRVGVECTADIHCDDGDGCTANTCVSGACQYPPETCNDNDGCTTDMCADDECQYTPVVCNDSNACTTDNCVNGACAYTPTSSGTACNDGLFCTQTDTCNGSGVCVGSATSPCVSPNTKCCEATDTCHPKAYQCP